MWLIAAMVMSMGCASLFSSGPDRVPISSNPPGAKVIVDGTEVGVTPTMVTLDRQHSQGNIRIEAPGYQPAMVTRMKSFNNVAILNCLNIIFWGIDVLTGNYQKFDSTPVDVSLVPASAQPSSAVPAAPPAAYPPAPTYAPGR
jgi:hypothetical protein